MRPILRLAILAMAVSLAGCAMRDVVRCFGGVNSDRASLNRVNSQNDNSFSPVD